MSAILSSAILSSDRGPLLIFYRQQSPRRRPLCGRPTKSCTTRRRCLRARSPLRRPRRRTRCSCRIQRPRRTPRRPVSSRRADCTSAFPLHRRPPPRLRRPRPRAPASHPRPIRRASGTGGQMHAGIATKYFLVSFFRHKKHFFRVPLFFHLTLINCVGICTFDIQCATERQLAAAARGARGRTGLHASRPASLSDEKQPSRVFVCEFFPYLQCPALFSPQGRVVFGFP